MKKNDFEQGFSPLRKPGRNLFRQKWMFGLLLGALLCIRPNVYAQQEVISFPQTELTVRQVFHTITKQARYDVFYSDDDLDASQRAVLSAKKLEVEAVLKEVLKENYSYEFVGKAILIRPVQRVRSQLGKIEISGTVRDTKGMPLPGVTVLIKNSTMGVSTDNAGKFTLEIAGVGDIVLVFSFVGMETREVVYRGEKELEIVMEENVAEMEEVVVTGYQQIEKRQLTSAVSRVKTEDLNVIGATSIEDMLQGQLAGLSVVNSSAAPGAAPKIRIRGTATISGNADPLWVLDGVMLDNAVPMSVAELNTPDMMNTFNSVIGGVSPNDIESITVLKDASATAIYGTRAANGVIVVTTKKGKRNGMNISYQHSSAVRLRPAYKDFDLLNSQERIRLTQEMFDDGMTIYGTVGLENLMSQYNLGNLTKDEYIRQVRGLETINTDWFGLLYRHAYTQTHNLSVSGGSEKMDYYLSLNYNGENGMDKVSDYKNYGGMAKINTELFKGVRLGAILQIGRRDRESYHPGIDPFSYAVGTSRAIPVYNEDGSYFFYTSTNSGSNRMFNILHELENTSYETTQTDTKGTIDLSVQLLKGLKYVGLYSYASAHSTAVDYAKENTAYVAGIRQYDFGAGTENEKAFTGLPFGGIYNETRYEQRTSLIRNGLEYKTFLTDELSLDAMVGQEFRTTKYQGSVIQGSGYMHDRGQIFYDPEATKETGHIARNHILRNLQERSYISYYAVLSAMYKNRYVVNGNIRFDGSNLFGSNPKYRYLPLWSVSGKWIVSQEDFLKNLPALNNLAVRVSYGLRGNIVEESTPQIMTAALPPNRYNQLLEMEIIQAPNPELKWETTSSLNVGLEVGLFDNRLSLDIDYYQDNSKDLIASKNVSAVTGFSDKYVNYADVKNKGLDLALSGYIVRGKHLSWMSAVNLSYVKNKVSRSAVSPQARELVKSVYVPGEVCLGKPVNAMFSYRFAGLDETGRPLFYDRENNKLGKKAPDFADAIYSNVENLKYEGTRDPILNGGFNNVVRYKDLTFSFLFSFGFKNKVRLPKMAYQTVSDDQNMTHAILQRWRHPGDEKNTVIPRLSQVAESTTYYMFNNSGVTVVPGDYCRLRNVMLEYRLPARWLRKMMIGERTLAGISLKFQAQNLFVIADKRLKGYDPETINYTTTLYGSLPLPKSFTLGLSVNF